MNYSFYNYANSTSSRYTRYKNWFKRQEGEEPIQASLRRLDNSLMHLFKNETITLYSEKKTKDADKLENFNKTFFDHFQNRHRSVDDKPIKVTLKTRYCDVKKNHKYLTKLISLKK